MYSLSGYCSMIADRARTDAYARALRQVLRPGCVCLDIGTGIGFFAVLACRLGARKVLAVEPGGAIEVAREVAAANGCADRVVFLQDLSTRVHLEERADVIVSDLRGVLPLWGHHLPSLADAGCRLLAPGGTLIPRRDTLWAAPVEAPEQYAHAVPLDEQPVHGVTLEAVRSRVVNSWSKARLKPEHLLAAPRQWASLDYANLEGANVRGEASWTVERPGTGHGLLLWFDATLVEGVGFSNAPGQPELIYGQAFFPWARPVPLAGGNLVEAGLRADLIGPDYVWRWDTRVVDGEGRVQADFKQSTFSGALFAPGQMRKRAADFVPTANEDAQTDLFVLGLLCAGTPLGEIARRLTAQFPGRFPGWPEALTRVGELSAKYSR
jgi:protein arginine N-methyltransferase 1